MNDVLSGEINKLEKAFASIERESPFLKPVMDAFKVVIINRAILKARISEYPDMHIPAPERDQFSKGQPWLTEDRIASLMDPWGDSVKFTMLPLVIAFPNITAAVVQLREALDKGSVDLKYCVAALVEGREEDIIKTATRLDIQPVVLKFILGQMLKPFVEKKTESIQPLIKNLPWHQGYCPVCGSFPELSFLQGDEGQRWLRCSLCGYNWRFDRMTCPYCGESNGSKECTCVDGLEHQWVESCPDCHRYIAGIDFRKQGLITPEIAAISMVHLDMIAQQKGFFPIASCAWNMISTDDCSIY